MTEEQINLIAAHRFPRLDSRTIQAIVDVENKGRTSYAAEKANGCKRGTVSRYVNRFHSELSYCLEAGSYAETQVFIGRFRGEDIYASPAVKELADYLAANTLRTGEKHA